MKELQLYASSNISEAYSVNAHKINMWVRNYDREYFELRNAYDLIESNYKGMEFVNSSTDKIAFIPVRYKQCETPSDYINRVYWS